MTGESCLIFLFCLTLNVDLSGISVLPPLSLRAWLEGGGGVDFYGGHFDFCGGHFDLCGRHFDQDALAVGRIDRMSDSMFHAHHVPARHVPFARTRCPMPETPCPMSQTPCTGAYAGGGPGGALAPPPPPKLTPAGLNESCKDWTFNKIGLLASLADLGTPPLSAPPLRKSCVRPWCTTTNPTVAHSFFYCMVSLTTCFFPNTYIWTLR